MKRAKTIVGYCALLFSIVAVATGAFTILFENPNYVWSNEASRLMNSIAQDIQADGIASDLNEYLASGSKPKDWLATVLFRQTGFDGVLATGQAVAASDPNLVGLDHQEVHDHLSASSARGQGISSLGKPFETSDGTPHWVEVYGLPRYIRGYTWLVGTIPFFSVVGAWLAIAAWVVMDVRELQKANVVAWGLLSLLTGPVALGVWLISRPSSDKTEPSLCPSCGSTVPAEAAYCVRCGHPILALCPKCERRVDLEWAYCGSCGTPLAEESLSES